MDSDPLIRNQIDADIAARLQRVTARTPRTAASPSRPVASPPLSPRSTTPPPPPPGAAPARKKRRHPARHSRSAALALSFVTTTGLAYAFAATDSGASATTAAPAGLVTSSSTATAPVVPIAPPTTAPATSPTTPPATSPTTSQTAAPAAPTVVNGASYSNRYGNVQVQATFAIDGSITSVDAIEVPYRDGESVQINNYAVPRLGSEALSAQSAHVHGVSGATYTSIGYAQSLQSAIDVARANGVTTIS